MNGLGLLRHVGLVSEYSKARDHKPKAHQCDACANPGEKRPLLRPIVPQVRRRLSFDGRIHFDFNPSPLSLRARLSHDCSTDRAVFGCATLTALGSCDVATNER